MTSYMYYITIIPRVLIDSWQIKSCRISIINLMKIILQVRGSISSQRLPKQRIWPRPLGLLRGPRTICILYKNSSRAHSVVPTYSPMSTFRALGLLSSPWARMSSGCHAGHCALGATEIPAGWKLRSSEGPESAGRPGAEMQMSLEIC